jgi:flavodoxin
MKKILSFMAVMLIATAAGAKTLVVYYSYTGSSREIVNSLTAQIEADVLEIQPAEKGLQYEANNYALGTQLMNAIKTNPNDASSYPAIDPVSVSLDDYQNIIIVTPLWWSQMAAIMQTYLFNNSAQMAGKTVALIVSSHSSGISGVVADTQRLLPNVTWAGDALWINASNHGNRASLIENWLPTQNFQTSNIIEQIRITIGGVTKIVTLVDNSATQELVTKLKSAPVTVTLNSSGGFEIWGSLGFSLTTTNEQVNAQPGDIVLYNGSNICMFYGTNSWSYTRLGHIDGLSESELRTFLHASESNISVTLSLCPDEELKKGDIDGDGNITVADIEMITNEIMNPKEYKSLFDINSDDKVNVADIVEVINNME